MSDSTSVLLPRISKSCDECKARKVRCIRNQPDSLTCNNCLKRQQKCHFSHTKRKLKANSRESTSLGSATLPVTDSPAGINPTDAAPQSESSRKLYIDHVLENRNAHGIEDWTDESCIFTAGERFVSSASLALFSESRIRSLSERIGHPRFRELIGTIGSAINLRMNRGNNEQKPTPGFPVVKFKSPPTAEVASDAAKAYIADYFKHVHPVYPFLDRGEFEQKAFSYDLSRNLSSNPAFSALYHTVLALGAQYTEDGSFEAGEGKPWKLYQVALGLLSDILLPRESLVNLQALTAMAIFASNASCMQINETMVSEAARMCLALHYNRAAMNDAAHRNFWVIYSLEKPYCYFISTPSILDDEDIGCPIPEIPEAIDGDVDWFLLSARFARIVSRAYRMLFTVSATMKTPEQFFEAIDSVHRDLETWRLSFPQGLRPGERFRPENCKTAWAVTTSLRSHSFYFAVVVSLCRVALHIGANSKSPRVEDAKRRLMYAARQIVDITHFIDIQPHTPIWILGAIPLSALFILFDFVVHNPLHPETLANLTSLDVAGSYFTRLEYASGGSLPGSLLAEFPFIARQFVRDIQLGKSPHEPPATKRKLSSNSMKPFEQVQVELRTTAYVPSHVQNPVMPIQEQQLLNEDFISSYADQLFYPTDNLQPFMTGDYATGFDMNSLFDSVIPNFQI